MAVAQFSSVSPKIVRLLDEIAFKAILGGNPCREVKECVEMPSEFWSYFDRIPAADFNGFDCSACRIRWAFRTADGVHDLVHMDTKEDDDAFMVLVVHLPSRSVIGHHFLDLKHEYELRDTPR